MIADLKPYAEYKESGLPWLGQVPGHWDVRVLKRLCLRSALYGANIPASDYVASGVRFLRTTDITDEGVLRRGGVFVSGKDAEGYMLADGDLLVSRSGTIGRSLRYRSHVHGPCSYAGYLVRFVPSQAASSDYLFHYTKSIPFNDFIRVSAVSATIENVNGDKFANMPVTLPPPAEQAAIVRFLDWANGRLEQAIRAKRKVIALLGEQKQAIIHRAVTRGLDPSVPLKPSGIPWLGDIPQHWVVERTKNVFRLRTQKSGLSHGKELLSIYTHIGVRPRKDLEQKGNKASTTDNYWIVQKGDLIVNKLLAWMGAVGSSDYEGVTSPAYDILMPIRPLCSDYYHHLFRTKLYQQLFKQRSRGIMDMRLRLYFDQLGQIPVPFPPVDEQAAIVAFYVEATADLTAAISRLNREIELLREYRTRLVADVVTGKLDVREAARNLPDEAEELGAPPEPNDITEELEVDAMGDA